MFVLLAHGSKHAVYQQQLNTLAKDVSAILSEPVAVATLSGTSLPKGAIVLPLFLGQGKHMQEDVPQLIQSAKATMLAPLFEHSDALAALIVRELTQDSKRIHLMFSVYQFTGFGRLVASLYQQSKGCTMAAMSALHGSPNITNVLQNIQAQGVKKVIVQPVLLFDGHSLDMCTTLAKQVDIELDIKPALVETAGFAALIADILTHTPEARHEG